MKTTRIVLTVIAAALAYLLNQVLAPATGVITGEAALLQMDNSDVAAVASKGFMAAGNNISWIAVGLFVVAAAVIWLFPSSKKDNDQQ